LKPYNISEAKSPLVIKKNMHMRSVNKTTSFAVVFIIWMGGVVSCVTWMQEALS